QLGDAAGPRRGDRRPARRRRGGDVGRTPRRGRALRHWCRRSGVVALGRRDPSRSFGTREPHPSVARRPRASLRSASNRVSGALPGRLFRLCARMGDIRVGLRLLWKDKAFSLTAAATLAVCIGANTALFSVVHNVLLRPLPVADSERLVLMSNTYPKAGAEGLGSSGVPDYYDRIRDITVLEDQAVYNTRTMALDQNGTPARVLGMIASPSLFRLVRVSPRLGRIFDDKEGETGSERKVILSYALWQSAFGGDPQAVGKDARINGVPYAIVGVLPRNF